MLRFLLFVADLFILLPWWGAVGVLAGLAIGFWAMAHYIVNRFKREVNQAVLAQGEPLKNADVILHSVKPAAPPTTPSLLDDFDDEFDAADDDADDEQYDSAADNMSANEDSAWFWIEATITPQDGQAFWDPSLLAMVPADFEPDEEFEFCAQTAVLHTLEICRNGRFKPQGAQNVTGAQRLRMLFAVPHEVQQAKFAYHFTRFGNVVLPVAMHQIGV